MSTTASKVSYPALCPWLSGMSADFGRMTRINIEHGGATRHFDVTTHELTTQFATVFNRALKIKQELVIAEAVFKALNE